MIWFFTLVLMIALEAPGWLYAIFMSMWFINFLLVIKGD